MIGCWTDLAHVLRKIHKSENIVIMAQGAKNGILKKVLKWKTWKNYLFNKWNKWEKNKINAIPTVPIVKIST